ncbi:T9SS type A sorting domain-containing protein [Bacteroidota bacterium]
MKTTTLLLRQSLRISILIILISFSCISLKAQLAGTYYIGPPDSARADYNTLAEVNIALGGGITDSVIFNFLPGTYYTFVVIGNIPGAGPDKQVVFQSSTGDPADVILTHIFNSSETYIIRLTGNPAYITFKNLSFNGSEGHADYCRIISFESTASHIRFTGNVFYGKTNCPDYDNGSLFRGITKDEHIVIENNKFHDGYIAICMWGPSPTNLPAGNIIRQNQFYNQTSRAVYIFNQNAIEISDNYIENNLPQRIGISIADIYNAFRITGNIIEIDHASRAISLERCHGLVGLEGLVANNFIEARGTGDATGVNGIVIGDFSNLQIYHNSIAIHDNIIAGSACLSQYSTGTNLDIRNNIFYNASGGYAARFNDPANITNTNNNDYYTNGNYIVKWGGSDIKDLTAFQTIRSPFDDFSLSVNPAFFSLNPIDLHTSSFFLKDAGADLTADITEDIDGESRSTTPCIGADEYTTVTGAPLTGTITIGSDQALKTISAAVDSMNIYGISGAVTFNIKNNGSPYEEQIDIGPITGADASNRVTFQPDPDNTGDVVIQYAAQTSLNPWIVRFSRASFVTLRDLTLTSHSSSYPGVIFFEGNSLHDSILNCTINSLGNTPGTSAIWGTNVEISDIAIIGNTITDAGSGILFSGSNNPDSYPKNMVFSNNIFSGQDSGCISLERFDAPVVMDNYINSDNSTSDYFGIDLRTCPKGVTVTGNTVICDSAARGISLDNCDKSIGNESIIANNIVDIQGGTDTASCIQTINSDYVHIYFNTVRIGTVNTDLNSNAYLNINGSNINIRNNIFCNFGLGKAYNNEQSDAIDISNNNVLFSSGLYIAQWDTTNIPTLAVLQSASGMDDLSLVANPAFEFADALHANSSFLVGKGVAIAGITVDKDGVTRSDPPDIGAYEISSPLAPMSGTYTIYGSTPDFTSIKQAFDTLHHRGVSGPVDLVIRSGNHEEYVGVIRKITNASSTDSIVIRSETGNPEDVIIFSDQEAYLMEFRSVDQITIKDITIYGTSPTGGNPLAFRGTNNNINVINNRLVSAMTNGTTLSLTSCITDKVLIKDNSISTLHRGIAFYGNQYYPSTNTVVTGNDISGASDVGIVLANHTSPKVVGNTLDSRIYLGNCHEALQVSGNRIDFSHPEDYESGLYLGNCHALELFNGLVSNNMVHVGGTSDYNIGIHISSCEYINFYHNSVHMTTNGANPGTCIVEAKWQTTESKGINIVNNVLLDRGSGGVLGITEPTSVLTSDFNSFHSDSADMLFSWGGTQYPDLAAWQAASGKDVNSIEVDPLFYSDTDLRSSQFALHEKATPLPEVPYDIDSVLRDPIKPDLGAVEFNCVTPSFNIYFVPKCLGDSTILIDSSMNIAIGSTRGWDFNGDLVPDIYSENDFDTISWLFDGSGVDSVTYIVEQLGGCQDLVTIDVPYALQPELEITTKGAYCDAPDGWATVTVTNLPGPFEYFWSDGQTTATATDLDLGIYTVAVTDAMGCTTTEDVSIDEAIDVTVTQLRRSTCGTPNGSAVVSATGGFPPYSYVWSNGETNDTSNFLLSGPQYVNVIDNNGCYVLGSISLEGDGGPEVNLVDVTINDCYGDTSGSIDIYVTGGVGPYSYLWSDGSTTQDIENLAAGTYSLTVTDRDDCQGSGSFQVLQPSQITISPVVTASTCLGSDGTAIAVVSGGTKPYSYDWSSGGTYQFEEGLAAGVYSVTVTDGKGCQMVEPVFINNINAPVVIIEDVQGVGCSVTDNGSISISASPPNPSYTYSWSSGQTTPTITDLTAGSYEITVTDDLGCKGVNRTVVIQEPPEVNPICLVTVDTATGMNMVIWSKIVTQDVSHYNVYRESSEKEDYQLIGSVGINEESLFVDSIADPAIRSWRYRLSVVDSCGNESELSDPHKTMHLTMNLGLDNSVNLIWDHYEGFPISTYQIRRYDAISGWVSQADVPSNLTSYTDEHPINEDLTYYIEVFHPTGCTSTDKKASTLNSSRSNRKSKLKSSFNQAPIDLSLDVNIIGEDKPAGSLVGRFTTSDPDEGDTHYYSFVSGTGGNDNGSFRITGDSLLSNEVFDFETNSTYSILVSTTDTGNLSLERQFTIYIYNVSEPPINQAPLGISLDISIIDENKPSGTLVGRFTTSDPDIGDEHIYSLVTGTGSNDNGSFKIASDSLLSAEVFDYESKSTLSILVSTTDTGNLSFTKQFTIFILDNEDPVTNQAPTDISLDISNTDENEPSGSLIGRFTAADPDETDTHQFMLTTGFGGDDINSFSVTGDSLLTAALFDYEIKNSYKIRVKTTDSGDGNLSFEKSFIITVNDVIELGQYQLLEQNIMIYPNPFDRSTTIRFPNTSGKSFRLVLTDLSGKIYRIVDDINTSEYVLERGDLKAGLYFIELIGPQIFRGKIIIE